MIKALFKDTEVLFKDSSISRYGQSNIYIYKHYAIFIKLLKNWHDQKIKTIVDVNN